nr:hypothetical protein [Bacillus sp. Cs-700]
MILTWIIHSREGTILVDGKNLADQRTRWQQKIGYIPQSIFLSDDTIREMLVLESMLRKLMIRRYGER